MPSARRSTGWGCAAACSRSSARKRLASRRCLSRRALKCRPCGTHASGGPANSLRLKQAGPQKPRWRSAPRATTPKAAPLRQTLARGAMSREWGKEKHLARGNVATAAAGADAPPLSRRPRNGAGAGQSAKPCFSPVSPRRLRVPQRSALIVPDDVGGAAAPAAAARRTNNN